MLLNLGIIKHRLSAAPESVCGDIDHELLLHTVRLMPSAVDVEYTPGHLYVMQWDKRPNSDRLPTHMVCIGGGSEAHELFTRLGVCCLIFPATLDMALLFSEIQDIFTAFHNLHAEYRMLLMTHKPMDTILDFCMAFMKNFTFLLDAKYSLIESGSLYSAGHAKNSSADKQKMAALISAVAAKIKARGLYAEDEDAHLIEHVPADGSTPEFLYSHFFDGKQCIATLVVCKTAQEFYPFSAHMMQYLANLLQPCITGRYSPSVKTHGYIRRAILSLLEGKGCNMKALLHNLALIGWSITDSYQLIYIRTALSERRHAYSSAAYYRYESLFPDCISVSDPSYTYAVLLLHNADDDISPQALSNLRQLMTENQMECRISLPFNNFMDLKGHFDLVQSSLLSMGEQRDCVSMYRDVMAKHIISEVGTSFPLHALCHRAAIKLHEHDLRSGTELLITLEKYLHSNRSIQKAGDALFIHRNTINYRLKKIEELTALDLNDTENDLHLLLSCMVLRTLGEFTSADMPFLADGALTATPTFGIDKSE
ncbi:MAG: helix-turn-helix domain-containing protein [Oscillospiraceae bacterium]|nr:helix-turn-helix domain-containing protein [Oscillospiraceae bacterium]